MPPLTLSAVSEEAAMTEAEKELATDACHDAFKQQIGAVFTTLAAAFSGAASDAAKQEAMQRAERGVARSLDLLHRMVGIIDKG
jgi:cytochrome c551/c552